MLSVLVRKNARCTVNVIYVQHIMDERINFRDVSGRNAP
jgi:hypothetical protein